MGLKDKMPYLLAATVVLFFILVAIAYSNGFSSVSGFLMRVFALWGYTSMSIATISTPFIREIREYFGVVFLKLHHAFAAFGLVFISLHPITLAIRTSNLMIFIPSFGSWYSFWSLAGRPALIIIYVAVAGFYLRRRIPDYWRQVHALMYFALFFGIVHGNLIGTDFNHPVISVFFNLLFLISISAYILKRRK
jgi:hypothetical protein